MTCASPSVTLRRSLRRWLAHELRALAAPIAMATARHRTDTQASSAGGVPDRKHFTSWQHCCLLLAHGLSGSPALRETYRSFADLGGIASLSGLVREDGTLGVSYPQLAASNTTRSAALLGALLGPLIQRAAGALHLPGLPDDLLVLDGTYLPLSLLQAPWLTIERGIQLQVLYHPASATPLDVVVPDDPRRNDYQGLDELLLMDRALLAALAGQTLVVDRGYFSTVRFKEVTAAGIHIITRRHPQAHLRIDRAYPIQTALPLPGTRITVTADQRITLGSPTFRKTTPLPNWRLVTATVEPTAKAAKRGAKAVTYEVLTDRWDLTAAQVVCGYLWRWQIELFFRWLKRHLRLIPVLGYSDNAVLFSIWLSLLVHLLLVLATLLLGHMRPSVVVRSALIAALHHLDLSPDPHAPT